MLGGDIFVFGFMLLHFLFHIWYIDFDLYYEVIHGICLLFYVCEIKKLIMFYLYFPHMGLCVC